MKPSIFTYSEEFKSSTPTPDRPATTVVNTSHSRVKIIQSPNPIAIDEPRSLAHDEASNLSLIHI